MSLRDRLNRIINTIVKVRDVDPVFPPFVHCPICRTRTYWLDTRKVWRCQNGHSFLVDDPAATHFPPPRIPGDKGDNTDGEI